MTIKVPSVIAIAVVALCVPAPGQAPDTQPATEAEIGNLVDQLDADDYPTRQAAQEKLLKIGYPAADALNRMLRKPPSEEARQRGQLILGRIDVPSYG
ncbi:unnamed protein product, partial [marine sediment metagenome]